MATATMTTQQSAAEPQRPRFPLTDRELSQYSLARAILVSTDNQEGSERAERNCFELEVSQTIEKSVTGKRYGGIFIPWNIGAGEFGVFQQLGVVPNTTDLVGNFLRQQGNC